MSASGDGLSEGRGGEGEPAPGAARLDQDELDRRLRALQDWRDWQELERELFRVPTWPTRPLEDLEADLERPAEVLDGRRWLPLAEPYDVPPELVAQYEDARSRAFERLDPAATAERAAHPGRFDGACRPCRWVTPDGPEGGCPRCGRALTATPRQD